MSIKSTKAGQQSPISAHPAFPAVVALWFAALLGLACLVVPAVVFESLFAATGIADIFPSAAAPLGPTARLSIALAAAMIGAGSGLFLARKVTAAAGDAIVPRHRVVGAAAQRDEAKPKRPISAHEELGTDSFDEPVDDIAHAVASPVASPFPGRRRALSVTDESERSELFEAAPLPGGHAAFDEVNFGEDDVEALDLGGFAAAPVAAELLADDAALPDGSTIDPADSPPVWTAPVAAQTVAAPSAASPAPRPFDAVAAPAPADSGFHDVSKEDFTAMSNHRPDDVDPAYNPLAAHVPHNEGAAAPYSAPQPFAHSFAQPSGQPAGHLQNARLSPAPQEVAASQAEPGPALQDLGMVELVERFARALQHSNAVPAEPAMPSAPEPVAAAHHAMAEPARTIAPAPQPLVFRRQISSEAEEPTTAAEAAPAMAEPAPMAVPDALRPMSLHDFDLEDDDETDMLNLNFPAPAATAPRFQAPEPVDEATEAEDQSEAYSSLLSMKGRFATPQPYVRIEDEEPTVAHQPVVVFPGQENRRAEPASDGPTRDPLAPQTPAFAPPAPTLRPFDGPAQAPVAGASPRLSASPGETEKALREALEKLQRMSGTR